MVSKHLANLKHSQFFAEILLKDYRLYEKGGANVEVGLRLFDVNWKNIELGQEWAAQQAGTDVNAATLTSEYPEQRAHYLYLRLKSAERIKWLEAALDVVHALGFELVEGTLHSKIGLAFAKIGRYQTVIDHYSLRLEIAGKI